MLHEFVLLHRDALVERCREMAALRDGPAHSPGALAFGIPRFIDQLIETLGLEQAGQTRASLEVSGSADGTHDSSPVGSIAARHGLEMSEHGFTVEQVVHDYGDLCQAITDLAVQTHAQIPPSEFRTLNRCLDNGIADALKEFTRRREMAIKNAGGKEVFEMRLLNEHLERRVALRTSQLEAANFELKAFSYAIAHDLRAPLATISGFVSLLTTTLPPGMDDRLVRYLGRIRGGAAQMSELIDALLSLAHVSHAALNWGTVDLSALVRSALADLGERESGRSVQADIRPGLVVQGDFPLLGTAITNLLTNAWKFSAGESPAQITFGCEAQEGGEAVYFVRDNGTGFDMACAGKLFGVFERMHSSTQFPGTGIGLANVKRVIDRHGGRIWAQSEPGHGATFYFTLGSESNAPSVR